jgi:hypothetical protein
MLLKHVKAISNWRVVSKVLCFWQLKHHMSDLHLQINHLEAELQGVAQAQAACKEQLELAHLKYYTADLHVLSTTEPQTE